MCWCPSAWSSLCPSFPPASWSSSFRSEWIRPSTCSLSVEFSRTFTGRPTFSGIWLVAASHPYPIMLLSQNKKATNQKSFFYWYSAITLFPLLWSSWSFSASNKNHTCLPPTCPYLLFSSFYMGKRSRFLWRNRYCSHLMYTTRRSSSS